MNKFIEQLQSINTKQKRDFSSLPHGSNMQTQLMKNNLPEAYLSRIVSAYLEMRFVYDTALEPPVFIRQLVEKLNAYMDFLANDNRFPHQSDFVSSIIPEALCTMFCYAIERYQSPLLVSTQKDLAIECSFSPANGGSMHYKNKRVDVAVVKPCLLSFNERKEDFMLPIVTIEVKTNLDKNMISGVESSVSDLKKTFPLCKYYVVSELADFDYVEQNYAATDIDEIYILRKQKRSNVRSGKHTRNKIETENFIELYEVLVACIEGMKEAPRNLEDRLNSGKLINY